VFLSPVLRKNLPVTQRIFMETSVPDAGESPAASLTLCAAGAACEEPPAVITIFFSCELTVTFFVSN
jgi:hypothetical protein